MCGTYNSQVLPPLRPSICAGHSFFSKSLWCNNQIGNALNSKHFRRLCFTIATMKQATLYPTVAKLTSRKFVT